MPLPELLKPLLVYALLFAVLTIPLDLIHQNRRRFLKALALAVPLLLLAALASHAWFLYSLDKPLHFSDSLQGLSGNPACPGLNDASFQALALTLPIETGEACNETMNFEKEYSLRFQPRKTGIPSEPLVKGVYQKGQASRFWSLAGWYDFSLADEAHRLLGSYAQDQNHFQTPAGQPLSLEAGKTYYLEGRMKERPAGFKPCKTPLGVPEWQLTCFVRCRSNAPCEDGLPASTDSCQFPETCHSYCKHDFGGAFTVEPVKAMEEVTRLPGYAACSK